MFLAVIEKEVQPAGNREVSQALLLSLGAAERISECSLETIRRSFVPARFHRKWETEAFVVGSSLQSPATRLHNRCFSRSLSEEMNCMNTVRAHA
ncbi:hypothetical protein CDAR_93861 [Caerostris darwini]|uniref:Uncharacterized protein n=1 Tax=Caerostris darwini TaxID=1538125 RepID=A0AAV4NL28_9ARAC|nr:hypothetical protein CDAR_93861 [Caerostris darwini]